jgi:hypothetical protein
VLRAKRSSRHRIRAQSENLGATLSSTVIDGLAVYDPAPSLCGVRMSFTTAYIGIALTRFGKSNDLVGRSPASHRRRNRRCAEPDDSVI